MKLLLLLVALFTRKPDIKKHPFYLDVENTKIDCRNWAEEQFKINLQDLEEMIFLE